MKLPLADEWINKLWDIYSYNGVLCSHEKKKQWYMAHVDALWKHRMEEASHRCHTLYNSFHTKCHKQANACKQKAS